MQRENRMDATDRHELASIASNTRWGHLTEARQIRVSRRRRLALAAIAEATAVLDATALENCGGDGADLGAA